MKLSPTKNTPGIELDLESGYLQISGRSAPEKSLEFYQPIIDHIQEYKSYVQNLKVDMKLEYFNTSSCKCLINIFKEVKHLENKGCDVVINWYAESSDEDMVEAGEDFQDLLDMEFRFRDYDYSEVVSTTVPVAEPARVSNHQPKSNPSNTTRRGFWSFFNKIPH